MKNREETEQKLINAIGTILAREGYRGLTHRGIAREAGVNKELIYRYFGSVPNLIEIYVKLKDYWIGSGSSLKKATEKQDIPINELKGDITKIIRNQFDYFRKSEEMQHIILSEIIAENPLLDRIGATREQMGKKIFDLTSQHFKNSDTDIRAVCALLVSGVYYLVLHAKHNESTVCGIDIKKLKDRNKVKKTIDQVLEWAFDSGG